MKYTCMLLFLFLFLSEDIVRSQHSQHLPPPRIYLVSVDIETQFDSIVWFSIPLTPNDYYIVAELTYHDPVNPGASYLHMSARPLPILFILTIINNTASARKTNRLCGLGRTSRWNSESGSGKF